MEFPYRLLDITGKAVLSTHMYFYLLAFPGLLQMQFGFQVQVYAFIQTMPRMGNVSENTYCSLRSIKNLNVKPVVSTLRGKGGGRESEREKTYTL